MNATTPETTRLTQRLRQLADELESAARYGLPTPWSFTVAGHEFSNASFSASAAEFDAWAEYTEATVEDYEHAGKKWRKAEVNVNGLPLSFATNDAAASTYVAPAVSEVTA